MRNRPAPSFLRLFPSIAALALFSLALVGCEPAGSLGPDRGAAPPFVERGDLATIEERGVLRVLTSVVGSGPRSGGGGPTDAERMLVESFARQNNLRVFWVEVPSRDALVPRLLEGDGDVVVANLTATPARREQVSFTVPVVFVREQIVTRSGDASVREPADLVGRRVAVRRSSSFWETLQLLRETFPEIAIEVVSEGLDTRALLERVAERRLDLTVADSNLVQDALHGRDDLRVAFDLTVDRPIAWAVRPDALALRRALNRFLSDAQLARRRDEVRLDDLPHLAGKPLRLLTPSSPATYFLWRGQLMGFEYELAREFARRQGLRLDVRVPLPDEDIMTLLSEGKGDLVAAALSIDLENRPEGVVFSRPYNYVSHVVVAPKGRSDLRSVEDLAGHRIHAQSGTPPWRKLEELRDRGIPLVLEDVPERIPAQEVIALVASGAFELAVVDSHVLDIELTWRDDVDAAFPLGDPVPLVWAVREENPELLAEVDRFLGEEYRGLFYNVIYNKYFGRHRIPGRGNPGSKDGALSAWDDIVRRQAEKYDLDWRLVVAQIYQESGGDPQALSFAGAVGLLQILPRTAEQLGITGIEDPVKNIHAGIRYLAWLREHFEDDLSVRDRMWFALASYNAGHGHVRDARRLAAEQGWDPDVWFDNVERSMLLLSDPRHARTAKHGYCRGREPVDYVREIRTRYEAYLGALASEPTRAERAPARL